MAKTLFLEAYTAVVVKNQALFDQFQIIHDKYQNEKCDKTEFDTVGRQVTRLLDETENRLCAKMENTSRGKYSNHLADKFRAEVRKHFPLIDLVGVTLS